MSTMSTRSYTITIDVQQIDVTSIGPRTDPNWSFVDTRGHEHRWATERKTFDWVQDEDDYMDADGEEYPGDGHYECLQCHEHLAPGMRGPSPCREYIPGPMTVRVQFKDGTRGGGITREDVIEIHELLRNHEEARAETRLREMVEERNRGWMVPYISWRAEPLPNPYPWPGFCQTCHHALDPPDLTWCRWCGASDEDE